MPEAGDAITFVFPEGLDLPPHTGIHIRKEVQLHESDITNIHCIDCKQEFPTLLAAAQHQEAGCTQTKAKKRKRWLL